jgi:hypothetical protein
MLRAMPKAKSKGRSASKATRSKASSSKRTSAKTKKASKSAPSTRKSAAIDPRVLAAIGLALEDERIANERAEALMQPPSGWVALGRARSVQTR